MLKVTLLFFATLRDKTGMRSMDYDVPPGTTINGLKELLEAQFQDLGPILKTAVMSINREFAFDLDEIPDGAEIAIFPPVSGG